ncbi:MAG: hypothetical protein J1E07_01435 [Treponema sp.]|nr:hypothetical protein [Treponema sp.]
MKKTLLSVASSVAFAAVVALVGCSAPTTVNYDTIESIGAPKVTAKTYAGVVRLTWNVVKGAQSYDIYKDGERVSTMVPTNSACEYIEYATTSNNLVDGVKYTYDVVAVPKGNYAHAQQRGVYIKENQTTVEVKAKVPSPEEFEAEYKSYFDKFASEKIEFKTELYTDTNWKSRIVVTAPTLPEFSYIVKTYVDVPTAFKPSAVPSTVPAFTFTENKATNIYSSHILGAGDIKTSVSVVPLSPLYQGVDFESNGLSVSKFTPDKNTNKMYAWYVPGSNGTKVHLEWKPAQSKGVCYAPAGYSVYGVDETGEYPEYVKVEGEVKVLNPYDIATNEKGESYVVTETTYYIEDTAVEQGDPKKKYFITLCVDGDYEDWWVGVGGNYGFDWRDYAGAYNLEFTASKFADGKTVRVSFRPVDKADSTSMYTVYRTNKNDDSVEKIGEVKAGTYTTISDGKVIEMVYYFVDDTVDNTVDYEYKLYRQFGSTITDIAVETAYGTTATARGTIKLDRMAVDKDLIYNDVFITITVEDPADSFILSRAKYNGGIILESDYTEVKVTNALWYDYNTDVFEPYNNKYYVLDKNLADEEYTYKVVFSGKNKNSSQETDTITDVGSNSVSSPVYVSWTGGSVVVEDKYLKNSETYTDYKYEYKILAREVTVEGTLSDTSCTVTMAQSGEIKPTEVNYTLLTSTDKYSYHQYETKPGSTYGDYIYYTGYRNEAFGFDICDGYGYEANGKYHSFKDFDPNVAYVHGADKYSLTTSNGLSNVIVYVTKTNKKTGETAFNVATIY